MARWFSEALEEEQLEVATLLTSELVTNALQHGDGRITLRAAVDDNRVRVEVMDEGGGFEHTIREQGFEEVEGWGLRLVDMQSTRWGTHEGTTHVWFELEHPGPRLGSGESPLDPSHTE